MKPPLVRDTPAQDTSPRHRVEIFLVEDHPVTRAGIAALVGRDPHFHVCGEADNAQTALDLIVKARPALVVLDIALKTSNGLELIKNLLAQLPDLRVLVMSMHDENLYAERSVRAGARGYLMKNEAAENIIAAIHTVLNGDLYFSDSIKEKLINGAAGRRRRGSPLFPVETLSDREMEVFQLIGNGFATRDIATRLKLSAKTIDSYREHLKVKLSLENSAELVRHAVRWARSENLVES